VACKEKPMKAKDMKVNLKIEGKEISMVPFVHDALRDVIIAFTNKLKDHDGGKIEIIIK
jgi:hypothetical protein